MHLSASPKMFKAALFDFILLLIVSHRLLTCGSNEGMFQHRREFYHTLVTSLYSYGFNMGWQYYKWNSSMRLYLLQIYSLRLVHTHDITIIIINMYRFK